VESAGSLVFMKMTSSKNRVNVASFAFLDHSASLNNLFGFLRLIREARRPKLDHSSQPSEMKSHVIGGLRNQIAVSAFALQAE
jgi:hypothetical protein